MAHGTNYFTLVYLSENSRYGVGSSHLAYVLAFLPPHVVEVHSYRMKLMSTVGARPIFKFVNNRDGLVEESFSPRFDPGLLRVFMFFVPRFVIFGLASLAVPYFYSLCLVFPRKAAFVLVLSASVTSFHKLNENTTFPNCQYVRKATCCPLHHKGLVW